jgi:cytochrome c556
MSKVAALGMLVACASLATPAFAQFQKPEDAIKYRQSTMFIQAQHFGRIGAMANGRVPFDANVATANAEVVATMSRLHWAGFMAGSEGGKAKPEIWKESAKFKEYGDALQADTAKMVAAARSANLDALKTAFTATAGSCKTCHDALRSQ